METCYLTCITKSSRPEVPCNFIKKEAPEQEFSCEFCKVFKSTYFVEHLQTAVSVNIIAKKSI